MLNRRPTDRRSPRSLRRAGALLLAIATAGVVPVGVVPAQSLAANLVTNTSGQVGSGVERFVVLGSRAVFVAAGPFGVEPWATDGTPAGTALLVDLMPGGSSYPADLVLHNGAVLFVADVPGLGRELWRTDGTTAGTTLVADILPGAVGSAPTELVAMGGFVYFAATGPGLGRELWRTDGTAAGTTLVADIAGGTGSSSPMHLAVLGNRVWFSANEASNGRELWSSDGTAAGTQRTTDLAPGSASANFTAIAPFGARLLLAVDAGQGAGLEPYVSDGTAAGTFLLADLAVGAGNSTPQAFTTVGTRAVFSATTPATGRELFVTDGTVAGTGLLRDFAAGTASGDPAEFTLFQGALVFAATGAPGREPWRTDGTAAGTWQLADLWAGTNGSSPTAFAAVNGELWFGAALPFVGNEFCHTDGTPAGTGLIGDLVFGTASSQPTAITPFAGQVLFQGTAGGAGGEPHVVDLTVTTATMLGDIGQPGNSSTPHAFAALGADAWFAAGTNGLGTETYRSDGTPTGTFLLADVQPGSFGSNPQAPVARGGDVFFSADLFPHGWELFVTDGVATTQLSNGSPEVVPRGMTTFGNLVLFSGDSANGREPWVSDGTVAGTHELLDLRPGAADSIGLFAESFAALGNVILFAANDGVHGVELWRTDGTAAGTSLVVDLWPGATSANPTSLTTVGGEVWFVASVSGLGTELWRSDGTAAGTVLVADLAAGPFSSTPRDFCVAGTGAYFTAQIGGQREICVSDGTAAGTFAVTNTAQGRSDSFGDLVATSLGLFFRHDDLTGAGNELWLTNGTLASTHRVADVGPGAIDGVFPGSIASALSGSAVVFGGFDLAHGLQLWVSDGTAVGTARLTSLGGLGFGMAGLGEFFANGARTFFACDDGINGSEPWVYDASGLPLAFVQTYGLGCLGSNGVPTIAATGLPQLGNAGFAIRLTQALPSTLAVLVTSEGSTNINLGGCYLLLDLPIVFGPTFATDAAGQVNVPLPIPNNPALVGYSLFCQWAVLDPAGPLLGALASSNGLQAQIGI